MSHVAKLPGILAAAAGHDLLLAMMPLAALGLYAASRRRAWRALVVTLLVPVAMILLFWLGVPFNNALSARYIFPATALFLLLAAMAFEITAALSRYLHVVFATILLWLVAGTSTALVEPRFLLLYGSLAALVALVIASAPRRAVVLTLLLVCEAAAAGVSAASMRACPGDGCALLRTNPFTRPTLFRAWDWMSHHVKGATIAYAGDNLPYRLMGSHFDNQVLYVNIDQHTNWRWDEYERAARGRPGAAPPDAPNFPYPRRHPDRDAWLANLRQLHVTYLFVARMSSLVTEDVSHNDVPFQYPIEDTWARADPMTFVLLFEDHEVRVYYIRQ